MKTHAKKCASIRKQACDCDGYHTFGELYDHRITLFIALCRTIVEVGTLEEGRRVWRSRKHADGTMYEGMFIMGIGKDRGEQITYHLPIERWLETAFVRTLPLAPEFDGHTPDDVIERLKRVCETF